MLQKEKPREDLSNHIEEFFPHSKRITGYTNDTPSFSNNKFPSNEGKKPAYNLKLVNPRTISPVKEDNMTDNNDLNSARTQNGQFSQMTTVNIRQDPSLSLNISEIQVPDKSPTKVNLNNSGGLFDNNTSFQNFMHLQDNQNHYQQYNAGSNTQYFFSGGVQDQNREDTGYPTDKLQGNKQHMVEGKQNYVPPTTFRSQSQYHQLPKKENQIPPSQASQVNGNQNESFAKSSQDTRYAQPPKSEENQAKKNKEASENKSTQRKIFHSRAKSQSKILHRKKKSFAEDMPGFLNAHQMHRNQRASSYFNSNNNISRMTSEDESNERGPFPKNISSLADQVNAQYAFLNAGPKNSVPTADKKQEHEKNQNTISSHGRSLSYPERPLAGGRGFYGTNKRTNLLIKTDEQKENEIAPSNIFSNTKVSRYGPNNYLELKKSYKNSVRQRDRKSYEDTQICKNSLSRIASQPDELKRFSENITRENSFHSQDNTQINVLPDQKSNEALRPIPRPALSSKQDILASKLEKIERDQRSSLERALQRNSYEKESIEVPIISTRRLEFYPEDKEEKFSKSQSNRGSRDYGFMNTKEQCKDTSRGRDYENPAETTENQTNKRGIIGFRGKDASKQGVLNINPTTSSNESKTKPGTNELPDEVSKPKRKQEIRYQSQRQPSEFLPSSNHSSKNVSPRMKMVNESMYQRSRSHRESIDQTSQVSQVRDESDAGICVMNNSNNYIHDSQLHFYNSDSNFGGEGKHRLITDPIENYRFNTHDDEASEIEIDPKSGFAVSLGIQGDDIQHNYFDQEFNSNQHCMSKQEILSPQEERYEEEQNHESNASNPHENYFNYETSPQSSHELSENATNHSKFMLYNQRKQDLQNNTDGQGLSERGHEQYFGQSNTQRNRLSGDESSAVLNQIPMRQPAQEHASRFPAKEAMKNNFFGGKFQFNNAQENGLVPQIDNTKYDENLKPKRTEPIKQEDHYSQAIKYIAQGSLGKHAATNNGLEPLEINRFNGKTQDLKKSASSSIGFQKETVSQPLIQKGEDRHETSSQKKESLKIDFEAQMKKIMELRIQTKKEQEEHRMRLKQSILSQLGDFQEKSSCQNSGEFNFSISNQVVDSNALNLQEKIKRNLQQSFNQTTDGSECKETRSIPNLRKNPHREPEITEAKFMYGNPDSEAFSEIDEDHLHNHFSQRSQGREAPLYHPDTVRNTKRQEIQKHVAIPQDVEEERSDNYDSEKSCRALTSQNTREIIEDYNSGQQIIASPNAYIDVVRQSDISRSRSNLDEIHEVDSYESSPNMFSNLPERAEKSQADKSNHLRERERFKESHIHTKPEDSKWKSNGILGESPKEMVTSSRYSRQEEMGSEKHYSSGASSSKSRATVVNDNYSDYAYLNHESAGYETLGSRRYLDNHSKTHEIQQNSHREEAQERRYFGQKDGKKDYSSVASDTEVLTEIESQRSPERVEVQSHYGSKENYFRGNHPENNQFNRKQHEFERAWAKNAPKFTKTEREDTHVFKQEAWKEHRHHENKHDSFERYPVAEDYSHYFKSSHRNFEKGMTSGQEKSTKIDKVPRPMDLNQEQIYSAYPDTEKRASQYEKGFGRFSENNSPSQERAISERMNILKGDILYSRRDSLEERSSRLPMEPTAKGTSGKPSQTHKPPLNPNQKNLIAYKPTNKQLIKNAITNVCLSGDFNRKEREQIFQKIDEIKADNFIIVFKGTSGRPVTS